MDEQNRGTWIEKEIDYRIRCIADESRARENIFITGCCDAQQRERGSCEYSFRDPVSRIDLWLGRGKKVPPRFPWLAARQFSAAQYARQLFSCESRPASDWSPAACRAGLTTCDAISH